MRVHGYAADGEVWADVASADSVSSGGVSFTLERPVEVGQVLRLDLPLPRTLRSFEPAAPSHRVYALVRNVTLTQAGYRVGTMFFGREPPRGFETNPAARFLFPGDVETPAARPAGASPGAQPETQMPADPNGRRASERFELLVNLLIQEADEWGEILREELTVTDNLSEGGARVRTTLELQSGDVVCVKEADGSFEGRARVCGASLGSDGIRRLHLKFLDGKAPRHLVRKR